MGGIQERIAEGLERAFVRRGFAEPSVGDLRAEAGVSLRTLYRHCPSRDAMVLAALEHRHRRYLDTVLADLPGPGLPVLDTVFERVGDWMQAEASHGCLFHAAVAASPDSAALRELLARHKREVADRVAEAAAIPDRTAEITLLLEGLTQSWPLNRDAAVAGAQRLAALLIKDVRRPG